MSSDSLTFEDLPEDQTARDCIAGVVRAGVIAPLTMKPPRFGPDYAVTRAQVAVYLSRAMGFIVSGAMTPARTTPAMQSRAV
jgi:hypothetical protein